MFLGSPCKVSVRSELSDVDKTIAQFMFLSTNIKLALKVCILVSTVLPEVGC